MAMKPRPLRAARKSNISTHRTPKLLIDSLDVQDFRRLFEQALNSNKALLHTQQPGHERTPNEYRRERQLDAIVQYGFRLAQQPNCLAVSREQEIASMLNALHQEGSWQAYIPSRLGHGPKVDLAAKAVITAYKYKLERSPGMAEKAYRQYEIAISTIRESIDTTDSSLMAVALLSLFEFLVEINSVSQRKHREGIGQILRARKRSTATPTEFERAILYGDWSLRYRGPIARGMASPFEDQYWLDMEPPKSLDTPPGLISLQKVTNQLLIRIPRLVICTRALRELSTGVDVERVSEKTIELASALLNSDNDAAESEILHRVSVVETADAVDRAVTPYSFEYATLKEMECCLAFWRMRIDVLRICLILCNLPQTADIAAATFRLDEVAIKAKLEGLISNIIMSRQYAVKNTLYGPLRLVEALFSAWAAASSLQSWRSTDMSFLRYWILKRFNDASFRPRKATAGFLDDECNVTIGGPLKGYWVNSLGGGQQDVASVCSKLPFFVAEHAYVHARLKIVASKEAEFHLLKNGVFSSTFILLPVTAALSVGNTQALKVKPYKREALQDIVTWDKHSIFVHGERVLFYSGEYHPFRLPVPGLWFDVFQKIRALGYTGVSVYIDWALLEGKPGTYLAEGIFDLQPFFDAAKQAGIYVLARPGPYINAEVSGGGFPGWLQRTPGVLRSLDPAFLKATQVYAEGVASVVAKNQITNGGPVILFQPENELYSCIDSIKPCPNPDYMQYVEDQFRNLSIVVPYIVNDDNGGNFAPGTPAAVDIYGIDSYPLGFDCANPETWPDNSLQTYLTSTHLEYSPNTPFSFVEFQGGSFDPWGGWGFAQCLELVGADFERVFYKNNFASAITIFSIYMTYGGSNWGNLGHPGGYSSYDYAAVIKENRMVDREKYSEAKLEANFVQASAAYLTATPGNLTNNTYTTSSDLAVTPIFGNGSETNFYVLRHANYSVTTSTTYKLKLPTSKGQLTIPQLGGSLTLNGRDSKVHVSDYMVGDYSLLYSSAEIFTWKMYGDRTVLVVYGGPGEHHELAVSKGGKATVLEGDGVKTGKKNGATILNWETSSSRRVVQVGSGLAIYILDRASAYNYWVLKLPNSNGLYAPNLAASTVIVQAGYLMRNATISGNTLNLVGDFNATTDVEVIGGAPSNLKTLNINGKSTKFTQDKYGVATTSVSFNPSISVPSLSKLNWKYIDSLPEIQSGYDDSKWPAANLKKTYNDAVTLKTPTSLLGTDYGFNTGTLVFRGHFTANGKEGSLFLETQGGSAFGSSVWLDSTYLGSWKGYDAAANGNNTFTLPSKLKKGSAHVLTVVVDQQGMDENYVVGQNEMKDPRGILSYDLSNHAASAITWKITGNLGGESYLDKTRGPLNEGGLWAERQGYHLPGAPISQWASSGGPTEGIKSAGIAFYGATLDLDLPAGWDVPLSFTFTNSTASVDGSGKADAYHVQLYVNGYQFGKYIHNVGPQNSYPVPEGIFNYHGENYIAFALWSLEADGAKVDGLELSVNGTILSGYGAVPMAPMSSWSKRKGAY